MPPVLMVRCTSLAFYFRYNLTVQLRSKIDVLGNVLIGLGASRKVPWPTWFDESVMSLTSEESGITSPLSSSCNAGMIQGIQDSTGKKDIFLSE